MNKPPIPYRRQGERPPLADTERRWFTKQGDAEKGPYAADVIVSSVKKGLLKGTTLVRAEDGSEWRPISSVDVLTGALRAPIARSRDIVAPDPRETDVPFEGGHFFGGLAAGFFGGCIGLGLVLLIAKGPNTRRGVICGFVAQVLVGMMIHILRSP
jgi:hypothetical protein